MKKNRIHPFDSWTRTGVRIVRIFCCAIACVGMLGPRICFSQEGPNPRARYIKKVENGRTANVDYLKRTTAKILQRWQVYQNTADDDPMKVQLYQFVVQQKDALISRIYDLCSESADRQNEYCLIYADTVR
ncbi:MAG: hypothetical protein K8I00_06005, partial [Candidatus Omnitrophica bacterium]|nr:hypothetical protein [Candidatus Omnitrophota bacterium]